MISVTADSNIFISAFTKDGPPRRILNLAHEGKIRLDVSAEIIAEFTGDAAASTIGRFNHLKREKNTTRLIKAPIIVKSLI